MSDAPMLIVEEGGEIHRLHVDSAVLGRSRSCDLCFDRPGVSRRHCEILLRADGTILRDLGSSHGTYLDGRRVQGESPLRRGQVVRLGPRGPRVRVLDARAEGASPPPLDESGIQPVVEETGTETAASQDLPAPHAVERTAISARPRTPAERPPDTAPASASASSSAPPRFPPGDVVLGLLLGLAAGLVLLVLVDLSALREALGLS